MRKLRVIAKDFNVAFDIARENLDDETFSHTLSVAKQFRKGSDEAIVAMLHDVVEDTGVTLDDLREADFDEKIVRGVAHMTKPKDADYKKYIINQVAKDKLSRAVKMADLKHNLTRSGKPKNKPKYRWALEYLQNL